MKANSSCKSSIANSIYLFLSNICDCRRLSQRGFTTLEQALVLPGVLFVVFAAVDVNNVIQGYSAIREGTKAALRCAYPVEGECVEVNFSAPTKLYNWYKVSSGPDHVYVRQNNYSAKASWFRLPTEKYTNISATVLAAVNYSALTYNYQIQNLEFEMKTNILALKENEAGPYAFAPNGSHPMNAVFKQGSAAASSQAYDNDAVQVISISNFDLDYNESKTVEFNVNLPQYFNGSESAIGCLNGSGNLTQCAYGSSYTSGNDHDIPGGTNYFTAVPFAMHVIAASSGGGDSSKGCHADLSIVPGESPGFHNPRSLGGRSFTGASISSFIPRGLLPNHVNSATNPDWSEYTEHIVHSYLLAQASGSQPTKSDKIKLKISLPASSNNTSCYWNGSKIIIATPIRELVQKEVTCANKVSLKSLLDGTPYTCKVNSVDGQQLAEVPSSKVNIQWNPANPVSGAFTVTSPEQGAQVVATLAQQSGVPGSVINILSSSSNTVTGTTNCPNIGELAPNGSAPNYGVAGDPNGAAKAQALAICPPQFSGDIVSTTFSETSKLLPSAHQGETFFKQNCQSVGPVATGPRLLYPKINFGAPNPALTTWTDFHTAGVNPLEMANPNSQNTSVLFNCGAFPIKTISIDYSGDIAQQPQNFVAAPASSLFAGSQLDFGECINDKLKTEALSLAASAGMEPGSYFEPSSTYVSEFEFSGGGDNCSEQQNTATPSDSCIPYRTSEGTKCSETLVASSLAEGSIPPECQGSNVKCYSQFQAFDGELNADRTENLVAASDFGAGLISAAYPQAIKSCSGDQANCFDLALTNSEDGNTLVAEASIKVPLNLLLGGDVTISYKDQERKELNFVR